ncbi:hypothetical protein [Citrobacter braakii]|uniref:hypothetical protein n=1 Tax=Citrobacter braakii TaxID=57706 RepID=UPI00397E8994
MDANELKHIIALLLEDAKRVQRLEPNSGTESHIQLAQTVLKEVQQDINGKKRLNGVEIVEAILERRERAARLDSERLGRVTI